MPGPAASLGAGALALLPRCVRATVRGVTVAAACLSPAPSLAQATPTPLARFATAPVIDGTLDDPAWSAATAISLAFEWFPGDNTRPPASTDCFLGHDETRFYMACEALDPAPSEIRANLADRDEIGGDDRMSLLLDPFNTGRRGFRFAVTPLGVQRDALYGEDTGDDASWDALWQSAGRITANGFVVELAIPFDALRIPAEDRGDGWRVVVERVYPRAAEYRIGSVPLDRNDDCLLCQGRVYASPTSTRRGAGIGFQPTLTAETSSERLDGDRVSESRVSVGASGRWSLSAATRVNVAVNPDFSQVEADAAEFEINRAFALSFEEKRPFFLDGLDFFDVPADLVFTRTIVDPVAGAKITGEIGGHAFGSFVTVDRRNSIIVPGNQRSERVSSEATVLGYVGRYRTDLPNASSIGALVTTRSAAAYDNSIVAADGAFRLGRAHRIRFVGAASITDDAPDVEALTGRDGRFGGALWNVRYDLERERWQVEAGHRGIAAGFRDDAGLVQRVDLTGPEFQVTHLLWGRDAAWFDQIAFSAEAQRLTDFGGNVIDGKVGLSVEYAGPLQSGFRAEHAWRREAFGERLFSRSETALEASARPSAAVELDIELQFGDVIDTENARLGRGLEAGTGLTLRPGPAVLLRAGAAYQRLDIDRGRVFRAVLASFRAEYHFSRVAFVRLIGQHRDVRRDPALFVEPVEPRSNRFFAQALFSYQLNPETVIFAGYSGTARDFRGLDIAPDQRSLFVKLGYGLRI